MTCRQVFLLIAALAVCASAATGAPTYCNAECSFSSCRTQACTDPESGDIITCQAWGTYNTSDWDCDGVGSGDNCPSVWNSNQADCDGDGTGDVCDSVDANYQPTNDYTVCHIDSESKLLPLGHWNFDLEADIRWEDVSSCNAPDDLRTTVLDVETCWGLYPFVVPDKYTCCLLSFGNTSLCNNYLDNDQCTGN